MKHNHSILITMNSLPAVALTWLLHSSVILAEDRIPQVPGNRSGTLVVESCSSVHRADVLTIGPDEYVQLHAMATQPDAAETRVGLDILTQVARPAWFREYPHWTNAMARLGEVGDAYTLKLLGAINTGNPEKAAIIARTVEAITTRLKEPSAWSVEEIVQARLERAAYADVTCSSLEGDLISWTLETTKSMMNQPKVKERLERLRQESPPVDATNMWKTSMAKRVQNYAERLQAGC